MNPNRTKSADYNREVGMRLRAARQAAGLSQETLAAGLGVTFQQLQKYEKGTNRLSAGALVTAAEILSRSVLSLLPGVGAAGGDEAEIARKHLRALAAHLETCDVALASFAESFARATEAMNAARRILGDPSVRRLAKASAVPGDSFDRPAAH